MSDTNTADVTAAPRLREMLAFAFLPTAYAEPSWWRDEWLPLELYERLRQSPRSQRRLSDFFLRESGLTDAWAFDLDSPHSRLALVPRRRLNRLVVLAGVTVLSPTIARTLRGQDRSRIRRSIGDEHYDFAIKRGRFLLQQTRLDVPDVGLPDFDTADEECLRLGVGCLASALQDAPAPLVRRMQLKVAKPLADRAWHPLVSRSTESLRLFGLIERQVRDA